MYKKLNFRDLMFFRDQKTLKFEIDLGPAVREQHAVFSLGDFAVGFAAMVEDVAAVGIVDLPFVVERHTLLCLINCLLIQ